jgi:hypothetical protein
MRNEMASVVRVEHVVADYDTWKREGFDRDLEFDRLAATEAFAEALAAMTAVDEY